MIFDKFVAKEKPQLTYPVRSSNAQRYWLSVFTDYLRWCDGADNVRTAQEAQRVAESGTLLADAALAAVEARWGEVPTE